MSADGLAVDVTFTGYGNKETVPHTDVIAWEADADTGVGISSVTVKEEKGGNTEQEEE